MKYESTILAPVQRCDTSREASSFMFKSSLEIFNESGAVNASNAPCW